jgi:hypothetical protein
MGAFLSVVASPKNLLYIFCSPDTEPTHAKAAWNFPRLHPCIDLLAFFSSVPYNGITVICFCAHQPEKGTAP